MSSQYNARVKELTDLAREENIRLPLSPELIIWHEDNGRTVDLATGEIIYGKFVVEPTPNAKAVLHLLAGVEGEIVVT